MEVVNEIYNDTSITGDLKNEYASEIVRYAKGDVELRELSKYLYRRIYTKYLRVPGETESRTSADRVGITEEARRSYFPTLSKETNLIFRDKGKLTIEVPSSEDITKSLNQESKGQIDFSINNTVNIIFKDKADASTAIHEFEHFYVEYLIQSLANGNTNSLITDDLKILAKFGKLKGSIEDINNWTTEVHENIAKGFERYFFEGKSPSSDLDNIFNKMSNLLKDIYRYARDIISTPISKEVREVFDRQLLNTTSNLNVEAPRIDSNERSSIEATDTQVEESLVEDILEEEVETTEEINLREYHKEAVKNLLTSNKNSLDAFHKAISSKIPDKNKIPNISLTKQLKAISNPITTLLSEAIDFSKYSLNSVMTRNLKSLTKLTPVVEGKNNTVSYLLGGNSYFLSDPALALLYDINVISTDRGNDVTFNMKEDMASIVDYSLREFFSTMSLSKTLNPTDDESIQELFNIKLTNSKLFPSDIKASTRNELFNRYMTDARNIIHDYGIPRTFITTKIGESILANAGITRNREEGTTNFYDRVAESLGTLAVRYASEIGLLEQSNVKPSGVSFLTAERDVPFIKMTDDNKDNINSFKKPYEQLAEKYVVKGNKTTGPDTKPGRVSDNMQIQGTKGLSFVPEFVRGVMKKIFNTPYNINSKLTNRLFNPKDKEIREKVLRRLGWMSEEEMSLLNRTSRESQEGINEQAIHTYDSMNDLLASQEKEYTDYFFKYSMTRGGRYNLISNTVNPQANKFHRFLMLPANVERTYTVGNQEQLNFTYFVIAQAFDALTNNPKGVSNIDWITSVGERVMSQDTDEMINDLISMNTKAFVKKYEEFTGIDGIENWSQALLVLQHIADYKEASKKGDGTSFESFLAIENDSTTSGYAIRMLNMPDVNNKEGILARFASKVGILRGSDGYDINNGLLTIHALKGDKDFLDIYKTMASTTGSKLPNLDTDYAVKPNSEEKLDYLVQFEKSNIDRKLLTDLFRIMDDSLPKPNDDGSVSGTLRKLIKVAAIPFGYTSGENSITTSLSDSIMMEFIKNFTEGVQSKGNRNEEQEIAFKLFKELNTYYEGKHKNLYKALMEERIDNIKLIVPGIKGNVEIKLNEMFEKILKPTYGKAVWESLSESFSITIDMNSSLNDMVKTMFAIFNKALEAEMNILEEKYGLGNIPIKEEELAIQKIFDLFPAMKLPYNTTKDGISESALLFDTAKVSDSTSKVQAMYTNDKGVLTSDTSYANVRKFIHAGQAGAVLPIHFMDGMIMSFTLDQYGDSILGVHDAFIMSAMDNVKITHEVNKVMYLLNKQFDIYGAIRDQFENTVEGYNRLMNVNLDEYVVNPNTSELASITSSEGSELTIDTKNKQISVIKDTARNIGELNEANRNEFYYGENSQDVLITNIDGGEGSAYKVDGTTLGEHQLYRVLTELYGSDTVTPLDGSIIHRSNTKEAKELRSRLNAMGADPNSWVPNSTLRFYANTRLHNSKTRVDIANDLRKLDPNKLSDKEFNQLVDVIINRIDSKKLKDLELTVEHSDYTTGQYDPDNSSIAIGIDNGTYVDPTTRLAINSVMSAVEVYAHELVHASGGMAIRDHKNLGITRQVHELLDLQRKASSIVTVEDFIPDNYDPQLESYYKENAEKLWDYIFNNPSTSNLDGLNEFLAYSLTHKKMRNKLDTVWISTGNTGDKVKFLDRVVSLAIAILDVFKGNGRIQDIFKTSAQVIKGNLDLRSRDTLINEIIRLNDKINKINQKAVNKMQSQVLNKLQTVFEFLGDYIVKGNNYFAPKVSKLFNFVDEFGLAYKPSANSIHNNLNGALGRLTGNIFKPHQMLAWTIGLAFSRSRRQALPIALRRIVGLSQQSVLSSVLRDIQTPDRDTATLEGLAALTRMVDGASKALEAGHYLNMKESFDMRDDLGNKRNLTDDEQQSLTKAFLYTDLQVLANVENGRVTNIEEIIELLRDSTMLKGYIDSAEKSLRDKVKDTKKSNWYISSSRGLANYMVTGKGTLGQNTNARNIVKGRMTGNYLWEDVSEEIVNDVDRLITLYALSRTDINSRFLSSSLTEKGLETILNTHKTFVKDTRENNVVESIHEIKGYTKSIMDNSVDIKVNSLDNELDMKKQGYRLVKNLYSNKFTEQKSLGLYIRNWNNPQRRDGAAFGITSTHAIGTSLRESAFSIASDINKDIKINVKEEANNLRYEFYASANAEASKIIKLMQNRELTFDQIDKLSTNNGGYMPIVSPDGRASDYRITMSLEDKRSLLGLEENAFNILSKMYASNNSKLQFKERNAILVQFLENDMFKNMVDSTKATKEGKEYVRLEEDTNNKFLQEAYKSIPKELMSEIARYDKKGEGLYVRDEWLQQLFGSPTVSIVDNKYVDKWTNAYGKKVILIAEHIMKYVAYIAKQNVIIRHFPVLLGNIMSNINLSIGFGSSPVDVVNKTIENTKYIRDYVDTKKVQNNILIKQKLGTATKQEIASLNWYKSKLENNPLDILMKKGMYQSIVEDISTDDKDNIGKLAKIMQTRLKIVPKSVKNVFRHVWMLEGTPIYNFMFQATQYSDFVARATEYQLQMAKVEKKTLRNGKANPDYIEKYEKDKKGNIRRDNRGELVLTKAYSDYEELVTNHVWSAFINYDRPQSSKEQYLNDMGLMMFTKFLKRIQPVIVRGLSERPISTLLFLMSQATIADTSDIYEYILPRRDMEWNIFNPVDNLVSATIPVIGQEITGIGTGMY
jgi:hypothetical protein